MPREWEMKQTAELICVAEAHELSPLKVSALYAEHIIAAQVDLISSFGAGHHKRYRNLFLPMLLRFRAQLESRRRAPS